MKVELRYGREGLAVELPHELDLQVLRLNPLPALKDEAGAIEESFRHPIDSPSLETLARDRDSACIVISDITRPVPNAKILEPMLATLHDSGIPESRVTLLVASGLHRPNEGAELVEMVGASIAKKYRIVNHRARESADMVSLGELSMGIEGRTATVAINRVYLEHDLKITTGLIEPHLMAGYSGGRKLICPGIASAETILQFHSPAMIAHPRAHTGNLEGNPVHAMSRAAAEIAGVDFICNVTLSEERRITGVFSGDLDGAHNAGIAHVNKQTRVPCRPADIVIASAAGYPLDTTLYQSVKGVLGAVPAVKEGGTIIVAASAAQGLGGPEFSQLCRGLTTPDEFIERIWKSDRVIVDQWQIQELMQVLQHHEVVFVTDGVDDETLRGCLLTPMPTVEAALQYALSNHGAGAAVTVIPEGPYVTPVPVNA